jgi:hypothetical protein
MAKSRMRRAMPLLAVLPPLASNKDSRLLGLFMAVLSLL